VARPHSCRLAHEPVAGEDLVRLAEARVGLVRPPLGGQQHGLGDHRDAAAPAPVLAAVHDRAAALDRRAGVPDAAGLRAHAREIRQDPHREVVGPAVGDDLECPLQQPARAFVLAAQVGDARGQVERGPLVPAVAVAAAGVEHAQRERFHPAPVAVPEAELRLQRVRDPGRPRVGQSERRVTGLAAGGRTNREIADTLFVTISTVEFHLRHAFRKLGIASRAQLGEALGLPRPRLRHAGSMAGLDPAFLLRMRLYGDLDIRLV
jgi:DNA-binding CsgD family transcriptional regulator